MPPRSTLTDGSGIGAGCVGELAGTKGLVGRTGVKEVGPELVQGIVAWVPLERADLSTYLDRLCETDDERIAGVRRSFEFGQPDFARRDEVIAVIQEVSRRGLVCDIVVFHPVLPAVIYLVRACPDATFVLDHLGKPLIRSGVSGSWSEHIAELAAFPNIVCKVSGLMTEADHARWRVEDLLPYIDHAIQCFAWSRLLFGSDWPVCLLAGTYERWLEVLRTALRDASAEQQRAFFADNARRVYRLDGGRSATPAGRSPTF